MMPPPSMSWCVACLEYVPLRSFVTHASCAVARPLEPRTSWKLATRWACLVLCLLGTHASRTVESRSPPRTKLPLLRPHFCTLT